MFIIHTERRKKSQIDFNKIGERKENKKHTQSENKVNEQKEIKIEQKQKSVYRT